MIFKNPGLEQLSKDRSRVLALLICLQVLTNCNNISAQTPGTPEKNPGIPNGHVLYYDTVKSGENPLNKIPFYFGKDNNSSNAVAFPSNAKNIQERNLNVTSNFLFTITKKNTTCGYKNGAIVVSATNGTAPYKYSIDNGPAENTGNFAPLFAGSHIIYVQDAIGVRDSFTVILTNIYTPPSIANQSAFFYADCKKNTGTVSLSAMGGTIPYTYSYDLINFQSSPTFTNLYAGIYFFNVMDANGCIATSRHQVSPIGCNYSYSMAVSQSSCTNEGLISFNAHGETPPYLYSLDSINYQSSGLFTNLGAGMHNVYIKDSKGIGAVFALPMYKSCDLRSIPVIKNPGCGSSNGSVTLSSSYGVPPYSYSLDGINFQSANAFTGLAPGGYSITTKDSTGQISYASAFLSSGCPYINAIATPASCGINNGSIRALGNGGSAPYSYSINGTFFQLSNQFDSLPAGTYTVTTKDANGFKDSTKVIIANGNCFSVIATNTNVVCGNANGTITATCSNGIAPYLYSLDGVSYQSGNVFAGLRPGLYTVYAKDNGNALTQTQITILDKPAPQLSIITTPADCAANNGALTINTNGGTTPFQYSIDGINFSSSNQFNNISPGPYTVGVKDANGCDVKQQAIVGLHCISINTTQTNDRCASSVGSISVSAVGGIAPYLFSINGGNFQSTGLFNKLSKGNYLITVKDASNQINTKTIIVLDNCLTLGTVIINTTCGNSNGSIAINGQGGNPPYQYSLDGINFQPGNIFSALVAKKYLVYIKDASNTLSNTSVLVDNIPGPGISVTGFPASCSNINGKIVISNQGGVPTYQYSIDSIHFQSSNVFDNLSAGIYKAWISDSNGCKASDTLTLSRLPVPTFFLGNDTSVCVSDSLYLNAPLSPQLRYLWQDGSTSSRYIVHNGGSYQLRITNEFNCSFVDTINILSSPLPVFNLGNDTSICAGKSLSLKVLLPNATYLWNTGNKSANIEVTVPGLYWLHVNQSGCINTDSIYITGKPMPFVNLGNDTTICEGKTLLLNAANTNSTYLWQDNALGSAYLVIKEGIYSVSISKSNCIATDSIHIYMTPKPHFNFPASQLICQGQTVVLRPNVDPQWQLKWQDGSTLPFYSATQPGLYYLNAGNSCGATREEVLIKKGLCQVYVPNAFSPNGDFNNDIFNALGTEMITEFHLKIFNRYGHLVFETTDKIKGWDGTFHNQPMSNGNYIYILQYKEKPNLPTQTLKGSCLLIR